MNIAGIQNAVVGMALFDMWEKTIRKVNAAHRAKEGDPLVAAACQAFEQYLGVQQAQHTAQINAVAMYALQPGGQAAMPVTLQQMAPFLALNLMA